jgi:putative redox protein
MATLNVTVHGLRGHQAVGQQEDGPVLPLDRPAATGGRGLGFNGGHLMLLGWGACYKSTLIAAAEAREIEVHDLRLEVSGDTAESPARFAAVRMEVHLDAAADRDDREKLVEIAKNGCIVSNTLARATDMQVTLADTDA